MGSLTSSGTNTSGKRKEPVLDFCYECGSEFACRCARRIVDKTDGYTEQGFDDIIDDQLGVGGFKRSRKELTDLIQRIVTIGAERETLTIFDTTTDIITKATLPEVFLDILTKDEGKWATHHDKPNITASEELNKAAQIQRSLRRNFTLETALVWKLANSAKKQIRDHRFLNDIQKVNTAKKNSMKIFSKANKRLSVDVAGFEERDRSANKGCLSQRDTSCC